MEHLRRRRRRRCLRRRAVALGHPPRRPRPTSGPPAVEPLSGTPRGTTSGSGRPADAWEPSSPTPRGRGTSATCTPPTSTRPSASTVSCSPGASSTRVGHGHHRARVRRPPRGHRRPRHPHPPGRRPEGFEDVIGASSLPATTRPAGPSFHVDDRDATAARAIELGGVLRSSRPTRRRRVVRDPQGAVSPQPVHPAGRLDVNLDVTPPSSAPAGRWVPAAGAPWAGPPGAGAAHARCPPRWRRP